MFHYLTMESRDVVQVGKLYAEYRDFYERSSSSTVEQLASIRTYGEIYRSLDTMPPGSFDATFMYRLRRMDVATVMPFILRLKGDDTLSTSACEEIMKHVESYLVRRMVCQMSVKSYNQLFVELLKATDAKGLSPGVVRDRMLGWDDPTTVWPDDKMFHTAWMEYRAYGWIAQARVRMVLGALEPMVRSKKAEDVMLLQEALTIEHLMPQSWGAHYPLPDLSLIHISEPTRLLSISYAVFCLQKNKSTNSSSTTSNNKNKDPHSSLDNNLSHNNNPS